MQPDRSEAAGERPDTTVATVSSAAIAEMLAGALIDEGIPADVTGADRAYPSMDWAYGVQVRVPAARADEARAIIETAPDEAVTGEAATGEADSGASSDEHGSNTES